jgi:hypothetical protein
MRKTPKEKLEAAIWSMPYIDRVMLLTMTIVDSKKGHPVAAVMGLAELIARMTPYLPESQRYVIAERLRSCADRCEMETRAMP